MRIPRHCPGVTADWGSWPNRQKILGPDFASAAGRRIG